MKTVFVRQHICVVVASVILVSTFLSNDGWASSGSAGSEAEQQALGISATFAKWPDGAITWVYNSTKAPADYTDDAATAALFQAAIEEWEGVCGVKFTYGGVENTADILDMTDGVVVFQWELIGAAGIAGPFSTSSTETTLGFLSYTDGTLRMNPSVFAFAGGTTAEETRNRISFHSTVLHELGHLIGLGHSDRPDSMMNGAMILNSIVVNTVSDSNWQIVNRKWGQTQ